MHVDFDLLSFIRLSALVGE